MPAGAADFKVICAPT